MVRKNQEIKEMLKSLSTGKSVKVRDRREHRNEGKWKTGQGIGDRISGIFEA